MKNMKKELYFLTSHPLFSGIPDSDIDTVLQKLSARTCSYKKDEFILSAGDEIKEIGIVADGSVMIIREDYWGNRAIINMMQKGDIFAEAFIGAGITTIPVSVEASSDCLILFINFKDLLIAREHDTDAQILIINMIRILARKNVMLTGKMNHMTKKTTRDKLMSYLSSCAEKSGRNTFLIPFNRQELADFLSVDRSAMSAQLCRLRDEGIIEFHKNQFKLL
jgi:CRP-like cAMP-binding protein